MNAKLNILSYGTHHYSSFKLSNDVKADNSPVLACAFSDRTTRITSANYNHHVVVKDVHIQDVHGTDNRDDAIKKGIDHIYEEGAEQTERSVEPDMCLQEETSFNNEQLHTLIVSSEFHSETEQQTNEKFDNIDPENCLKVPELSFNTFDEGQQVDSLDDGDIDPFKGLPIPRTRTRSFGQSSVYSVKEISDDLYRKYNEDMKHLLRGHGFFETFPDPMTIHEAQQFYRRLDLPIPLDQEEKILPYPPKVTKTEYLSSGENEPSIDLNIVHGVSIK
ncbi:hypothetical protein DPMN_040779 [Dreissena polymorpha]|uniref:Uncharacterized protein n=1 Tax=Dreissena polymorpha TaxID=45954 RepID=A0A9D4CWN7_DREPO|nr:hypothetical protein DPMN_040779 [Dreissena polymorpha]